MEAATFLSTAVQCIYFNLQMHSALSSHENQKMTYTTVLRDFAVLISLVRGSMLASVSLFAPRLIERHEHNLITDQLLEHITVYTICTN